MHKKEYLHLFLSEFFNFQHYKIAVEKAKTEINSKSKCNQKWKLIKGIIQNKNLNTHEPLNFVNKSANIVLDKNTDDEAYKWLNLMIKNIDEKSNKIEGY